MKPKKKAISLLLAICLVVGLLPTTVFAADPTTTTTDKVIMLDTSGISGPTSTQTGRGTYYIPSDYVYFGVKDSDPIKWRVLNADKTNDGTTSGMFLLSEYCLDSRVMCEKESIDDDGDSARSIALVCKLIECRIPELPASLLDGAVDIVLGHVLGLGLEDRCPEACIPFRIRAALGCYGDFLDELRELLSALCVSDSLLVLDCCPFAMARHYVPL